MDPLSQTFSALSDPTRRAMIARLSKGEANVSELAEPFLKTMSLPAVTKHLKVLEKAGLITKSKEAQYRPCKLNGEQFKSASLWLEEYREFWEQSFDRLDEYLKQYLNKNISPKKNERETKCPKKINQTKFTLPDFTMLH